MAEGLLDIAQNASIRGMRVDGEDRFSVYDFVNYVCEKDSKSTYTHRTFARISNRNDELFRITQFVQFDGKGQKLTPTMTMSGLQILLHVMEGKVAKHIRHAMRTVFNRYMAGDTSMVFEIEEHAASDAPVHAAFRQVLAGDIPESDCPEAKRRKLALESGLGGVHSFVRTQHQRALGRLINNDSLAFLGCTEAEFHAHIQHKMDVYNRGHQDQPLTWANIHLDHIKPISATPAGHFDAEVLHYTNIQPLSAEDNLRKGARWSHDDEIFWRTHIFGNAAWEQVYLPE